MSTTLQNSVCGLCGVWNDDKSDDWTVGPSTDCLFDGAPAAGTQVSEIFCILTLDVYYPKPEFC